MLIYTIQIVCKSDYPNIHLNRQCIHYHSYEASGNTEAISKALEWIKFDLKENQELDVQLKTLPSCLEFEEFKIILNQDLPEESFDIARLIRNGSELIVHILDK